MKLLYENKIPVSYRNAFVKKVRQISSSLSINPNNLMFIMHFESAGTFSPSIRNPYSGGTGLIQFMPATAISLGTTVNALAQMSAVTQLDYVYKYYAPYKGKLKSGEDLYLVTFFPIALNKPDSWIFRSNSLSAYIIAKQNPVLDLNKDMKITKKEWREALRQILEARLTKDEVDDFLKKKEEEA